MTRCSAYSVRAVTPGAPKFQFPATAENLAALRKGSHVRRPEVLRVVGSEQSRRLGARSLSMSVRRRTDFPEKVEFRRLLARNMRAKATGSYRATANEPTANQSKRPSRTGVRQEGSRPRDVEKASSWRRGKRVLATRAHFSSPPVASYNKAGWEGPRCEEGDAENATDHFHEALARLTIGNWSPKRNTVSELQSVAIVPVAAYLRSR
jgi:hypothetical protein